MTAEITYPEMRLQVIEAVRALSDTDHQRTRWGRYEEEVKYYDDLGLNVHILYDDCMVLPDPRGSVPSILHEQEIPIFVELEKHLGPMLDELQGRTDDVFLRDPRWPRVVETAGRALEMMRRCDSAGAK